MSVGIEGLEEVREKLAAIRDKGVKKAAKAGINAGLTPLVQGIRSEVNGASISPELKKAVRQTLGKRLKKSGEDYVGKAGFAVGRQTAKKKAAARSRAADKDKRGVGISTANVHWFVLGTQDRQTAGGHRTGKIEALLAGFVAKAASSAESRITAAAADKITQVLAAEAAQKG